MKIRSSKSKLLIGLMSGMSHDGLDLALVEISGTFPKLKIKLKDQAYFAYEGELKTRISKLKNSALNEISEMNFVLGHYYANSVNCFLKDGNISNQEIMAIGSHGQTIFHKTLKTPSPSTLQIGSGAVIAKLTGIKTVSNFREGDIALGGQGAPLVPYVDFLLNQGEDLPIALNNLGSISNLTVVTPQLGDLLAFDTGPANMPLDFFASRISGNCLGIDIGGEIARKGSVIKPMLEEFLSNPYFDLPPPKAAGYLEFGPKYFEKISKKYAEYKNEDHLRTALEFTAQSIQGAYIKFIFPKFPSLRKIVFSGGGAKNTFLLERIRELLPQTNVVSLSDLEPELSDSREALAFAVLAHEFLENRPTNVPAVTGASAPTLLGSLNLP